MKKNHFLALVLAAALALTACGGGKDATSTEADTSATEETQNETGSTPTDSTGMENEESVILGLTSGGGEPVALSDIKIGFIHISDPSDMGYTYNHDLGTQKMIKDLGLSEDQVISKYNIPESAEAATALRELAEDGCNIIFATSFGYEEFVIEVAMEYPDIQFCHATGFQAQSAGLENFHNYFGRIDQARYLSGIAAGLKTQTNQIGYVAAMPFAEVISGFDAFYLGAKSVNPDVKMLVMYTNNWNDPTTEAQVAQALIDKGCDVLGQHADSTAAATTAEAAGVWHVGYNSDMSQAAPKASLISAIWDWSQYLNYAVTSVSEGKPFAVDWAGDLKGGAVGLSALNTEIAAEGTQEAIEAAKAQIESGELEVFTGPLVDNTGAEVVAAGTAFQEVQSAPTFDAILEGISIVQ